MTGRVRWLRIVGVIACYGLLVYAGQVTSDWALNHIDLDLRPARQVMIHQAVIAAAALYVLLLALPFMPGIEIGLGLIMTLGPEICLLVYLSTVVALTLSFIVGRLVPITLTIAMFDWLGLKRASDMVARVASLAPSERLNLLLSRVPARSLSLLLRHRYLALAVLLNLPGNAFVGGGGGIALVAGTSRLFSFPVFVVAVALGVAPFPLIYYLADGFR